MKIEEVTDGKIPLQKTRRAPNPQLEDIQHVNTLEDQEMIRKTQTLAMPQLPSLENLSSLKGRVATDTMQLQEFICNQLDEIDPAHFEAIEEAANSIPQNYITQVEELIAKLLVQLNEISQKDRDRTNKMKEKYKLLTTQAADLQKSLGSSGLKFSALSLAVAIGGYALPHQNDQKIMQHIASQFCPSLGKMFEASLTAGSQRASALASLILSEYQAKTGKQGGESAKTQEFTQLLQMLYNGLKEAARAG